MFSNNILKIIVNMMKRNAFVTKTLLRQYNRFAQIQIEIFRYFRIEFVNEDFF